MDESTEFQSVDFEIALTALLATLVTAYPSPAMAVYPSVKLSAISLLALTLIKRIAISNGFTAEVDPVVLLSHLWIPRPVSRFSTAGTSPSGGS